MEYLWTKRLNPPDFPALSGDIDTNVLIIGGGMAGILCALKLQQAGVDYLLVEGEKIGNGITRGTTAVLTAQHDTLYQDMLRKSGKETAAAYLQANLQAVRDFGRLSRHIPCDYEERPSIMYSLRNRDLMENEANTLHQLGFGAEFTTRTPLPFPVAGAVRYNGMAQFHPLKFLYGAAENLHIYENTYVTKLDQTTAYTDRGVIHAKKVIVATHFPFINRHGLYFVKLYQRRSFIVALENAPDLNCTLVDADKNGAYLRNYHDLLLVGGGGHRTGQKGGGFPAVREFCRQYFPEAREKLFWANQDCVSLDGVPYIGSYSKSMPDVYVASGFNLWGMTTSLMAADILVDLVLDCPNPYAAAFAPDRNIFCGQLLANLGVTTLNFLTPMPKRCPHMGCFLKWNPAEHSWDCPCHGSRFDEHGQLIDNPAMKSKQPNL